VRIKARRGSNQENSLPVNHLRARVCWPVSEGGAL